ncbi:non-ribosomal peptide synthetase [Chitinophaga qingshengii]|uniref:Amino acid adenylation domain-containing protein n=1 Tax=Chitinophaga qingshengii TaxID=1569794 RepID=A0ABR7TWN9_9BACT|nr:non-ribosomal peptide synthetase [Chitinophaga qingshengii]MBC9934891.1 amino acid adenylation domain-containing protein [Chitinophaga qingshengii]
MSIDQLIGQLMEQDTFIRLTGDNRLQVMMPKAGAQNDALLAELRSRKAEVIAWLQNGSGERLPVAAFEEQDHYPCSHSQQRLWLLQQLIGDAPAYHIAVGYQFPDSLDIAAFRRALALLVSQHESLRTSLREIADEPRQVVLPDINGYFFYTDYSDESLQEREMMEKLQAFRDLPFQLDTAPLFRIGLWKRSAQQYYLLFVMHHIISDGWSIEVLMKDLIRFYRQETGGSIGFSDKLPIQYRDYTMWLETWLQSGEMQRHRDYWLKLLGDDLPVLDLPVDYTRPVAQTFNGRLVSAQFPVNTSLAFAALLKEQGCTLFMGLTALMNTLFFRYTNQQDIVLGTPVAARPDKLLEDQVGFYINTIVLRTKIQEDDSFLSILKRTRETVLSAYEHQLYPFDKLVKEVSDYRDTSRSPVFDVLLSFNPDAYLAGGFPEDAPIHATPLPIDGNTSQLDLSFDFTGYDNALAVCIEYNTDLFSAARIDRMIVHLQLLMREVVAHAHTRITALDYIPPAEKELLLYELNYSERAPDYRHTIHELFEREVEKFPAAPAVIHGATVLSFRDLNTAANRIAHLLLRHGIRKGDFVGVYLERGADLACAIIGIIKAGGVYVPLDPQHPKVRIQLQLQDSTPFALITAAQMITTDPAFFKDTGVKLLLATDKLKTDRRLLENMLALKVADSQELNGMPENNPDVRILPEDWAYMVYTSGTTGKPKGAILRHDGAVNHILAEYQELSLADGFRFLQSANISSDISVWQFMAPWLRGGACVIIDKEDIQRYDQLLAVMESREVSIVEFVTSYLAGLISFLEYYPQRRPALKHLQWMMIVGEEVTPAVVNKWRALYPHVGILNGYGPAEASDDITQYIIADALPADTLKVPIGRPLPNLNIFLLDSRRQLLPFGYYGEICVSGIGVGAGYWNLPEKTSEVFIPNSFAGTLGETIYRTGDLGRWLADGNLEFCGRTDMQIKVRGFRVEVAEIEMICRVHEWVEDIVVEMKNIPPSGKALVAYVIKSRTEMEDQAVADALQDFLAARLPDYMWPSYFVFMQAFPVNLSDKVDRKALPAPTGSPGSKQYAPPESELESKLLAIWEQVLEKDGLGVLADFFRNGGHSLKAIQITSRIYHDMGLRVSLKDIFMYPAVRKLAAHLATLPVETDLHIDRAPEAATYPLSHAQQRIWVSGKLYEGNMAYNMPMKYIFNGRLNAAALRQALYLLAGRHEILRTAFIDVDGVPSQKILPVEQMEPHLTITGMRGATEDAIREKAELLLWQPFDLKKGMLFRVDLLQVEEEKYLLLFVLHHIISDGWSEDIFLKELTMLYDSCCKGNTSTLPPLKLQYRDYAVWQLKFLESQAAERQLRYWLDKFSAEIPLLQLPVDYPRQEHRTFDAIDLRFTIPSNVADQLRSMAAAAGASLFMVLQSAIYVLLYRFTAQTTLVIGSPVAARTHVDLEGQIGCYMNMLALLNRIDPQKEWTALLHQVKENTLDAFNHQDYPFDLLLKALQPQRHPGRLPLFDVGFTWLNTIGPGEAVAIYEQSNYTIEAYAEGARTVKADLWVHAWEDANGEIGCSSSFNKGLFSDHTARLISGTFSRLMHQLPQYMHTSISTIINELTVEHKNATNMNRNEARKKNLEKFFQAKAQPATVSSMVNESLLSNGASSVKLVESTVIGVKLNYWIENNRAQVDESLRQYGGILFRGFNIDTPERVQEVADSFDGKQLRYFDQTSPRSAITGQLYTSTDHPHHQVIHMHNELSYSMQWPLNIMFCCITPATAGGETPIADVRQVWKQLRQETKDRFAANGVRYVRNMRNGVGLSWQQVFQTDDKSTVEQYFADTGIDYNWISDDHLRTRWDRPAVLRHPFTKEEIWFNHGYFYNEWLMEDTMRQVLGGESELPFNTYYGNGLPIEEETIAEIAAAFEHCKIVFQWKKGDVLLLDNMLMAHGRNPFEGNRKIVVAMFNPITV